MYAGIGGSGFARNVPERPHAKSGFFVKKLQIDFHPFCAPPAMNLFFPSKMQDRFTGPPDLRHSRRLETGNFLSFGKWGWGFVQIANTELKFWKAVVGRLRAQRPQDGDEA